MAKKHYNIGISGSYGGFNLGDEAILQCIMEQLRASFPVRITVFSKNPDDTRKRHKVEKTFDARKMNLDEAKSEIKNLDLFILGGGGILYDAHAHDYLREVEIALDNKVPVMVYAIGAGPLQDPVKQNLVRDVLNKVNVITVREHNAQKLLENIGVKKEITVTADPALLLKPEPLPESFFSSELFNKERNYVGFSVREPGVAAPGIEQSNYHALLANAADFVVDRLDSDVIFFPMERQAQDMQQSHGVISMMLRPQHAYILKGDYTAGQVLSIMGHMKFAVGMRLHFLIFAALQKIPFVALPYSSKVEGFLEELGVQVPPIHKVNAGRLLAYIDYFWDIKPKLKEKITRKLPELKQKALETNRILVKLMEELYE